MKLKSLLLSTVLVATPWLANAQSSNKADLKEVTNNIDTDGQFFMANNIEGDLEKLAALGTDFAQNALKKGNKCFPEGMDFNAILKDFGLDQLYAYGRSAKHAGDHWVNKMYLQTGGSKKGIFSMMGENSTDYQVIKFAPSGTDMVMEINIDTRQLMSCMKNVPKCERFKKFMDRQMLTGGTAKDLFNQFNAKMSLAVKLDDKERTVCPKYPEYTFPKMHSCFRMEGANLIWKQVGGIAGFLLKTEKQDDGTLLLTPRQQKKGMEVVFLMDTANDLLWAATSPEFLVECRGNGAKLASDAGFKAISDGTTNGNGLAYISRRACLEIAKVKKAKFKKKDKKPLSDSMINRIINHLTESKNGYYAEVHKSENGINYVLKAPCPVKEILCGKRGCRKGCGKGCAKCKKDCKGCKKPSTKGNTPRPSSENTKPLKAKPRKNCECGPDCDCNKGNDCKCDKAKPKATPKVTPKTTPKADKTPADKKENKKRKKNRRVVPKLKPSVRPATPEVAPGPTPEVVEPGPTPTVDPKPQNDSPQGDEGDM